jgi:hypothetical protein
LPVQAQHLIIAVFPLTKLWQDVRYGAEEKGEEISGGEGGEGVGAGASGDAADGKSSAESEGEAGEAQNYVREASA